MRTTSASNHTRYTPLRNATTEEVTTAFIHTQTGNLSGREFTAPKRRDRTRLALLLLPRSDSVVSGRPAVRWLSLVQSDSRPPSRSLRLGLLSVSWRGRLGLGALATKPRAG